MVPILLLILSILLPIEQDFGQVQIEHNEKTVDTIERNELSFLSSKEPFYDLHKINQVITRLNEHVYKAPVNATIDYDGAINDGEIGFSIDTDHMFNQLLQYYYHGKPTIIKIAKTKNYPRVTSELLAKIREKKLGSFITYYQESSRDRTWNIILSTNAINNHVVFPGERFSFNDVVGERTAERGYRRAQVIVKGELSEDLGGGICQVSSTLYNAVDINGIEIIERYSHSRPVPYVPSGRDATVSWWGPDFVFENKLTEPILIQARSKNGQMAIGIYSSKDANIINN